MIEQAITYKLSKGIRRAKERFKTLSIWLPVILVAFIFLSPTTRDDNFGAKMGFIIFLLVVLGLLFYLTASIALRKLSELSVSFFSDRLERATSKHTEIYLWKDVRRAEILEYPDGEISAIKLILANKKSVTLHGFDEPEIAFKQIEAAIPTEASIRRKRMKLNWDQPAIIVVTLLLTMVTILAIQQIGEKAYRVFNALFSFSFGLYNLVFKPISSAQGERWRIFEVAVSVVLIFSSVAMLVLQLLP